MSEVPVSINHKIVALSLFNEICLKTFSLTDIFQLHKDQVIVFVNMSTTRKS